ncbi:hypothetical protein J7G91_000584 [Salmonella enterica]|nr:hypothetical protein [Salmonella enterica]
MMNKEIHPKAIEKIKNSIREIVLDSDINKLSSFDYKVEEFERISSELNKAKVDFNVNGLMCKQIFISVSDEFCRKNSLFNIIALSLDPSEKIEEFINEVYLCYESLPWQYEINFSLKDLELLISVNDGEYVNLELSQSPDFLFQKGKYHEISTLKIKNIGYFSGSHFGSFMKGVIQNLNVIVFLLRVTNVIKPKGRTYPNSSYIGFMEDYIRGSLISESKVNNIKFPYMTKNINIPIAISKYLSEIKVNADMDNEELEYQTKHCFNTANILMAHDSKEASRIKSAIDWYVQSDVTDDDTMSFVQVCMGLESIFGDDDYEGGLTTILSDRCAYLIGKNIKDRGEIKTTFRKIYQIRSKIVHGVRNHLSANEEHMLYYARSFLRMSILKELDNLELS